MGIRTTHPLYFEKKENTQNLLLRDIVAGHGCWGKNIMVKVTTTPGKYPSSYFYFYLSLLLLWHTVYSHPPIPWVKNYSRLPPLSSLKPFQLSTTEKCTLSQKLSKIYWHIFDLMCKLKANGWTGSWKKQISFHTYTLWSTFQRQSKAASYQKSVFENFWGFWLA